MGLSADVQAVIEDAADMAIDLAARVAKTNPESQLAAVPLQTLER